jgi:hypothetical protein
MRRTLVFLAWFAAAGLLCQAAPSIAQELEREAALKAAFLYNFAKFTEWPADRFRNATDPLLFCISPNSRLRDALAVLPDKLIGTHPVRLVAIADEAGAASCHVLYVDDGVSPRLRHLAETDLFGVLTVSDLPNFARAGGGIGFYFASNQLRFQINLDAARRSGIGFSSKLLRLAEVIGQQSSLPARIAISMHSPGWL